MSRQIQEKYESQITIVIVFHIFLQKRSCMDRSTSIVNSGGFSFSPRLLISINLPGTLNTVVCIW